MSLSDAVLILGVAVQGGAVIVLWQLRREQRRQLDALKRTASACARLAATLAPPLP